MNIFKRKLLICLLLFIAVFVSNTNMASAEYRYRDLYTNVNKAGKYRYYSSPEGSAYIDKLPAGYIHVKTEVTKELNPETMTEGDTVQFKTTEDLVLSNFLTLPTSSIISGKI